MTKSSPMTREQWLEKLALALATAFAAAGKPLPERIRMSCGFPSKSALARKAKRIGECWYSHTSADKTCEIFISPLVADPIEAGAILVHELCHAALGPGFGHKAPFRALATALGLEGSMSATVASQGLKDRLTKLVAKIGPYPHAQLMATDGGKKQSTRLLKVECPDCGCVVRMTAKWLDSVGAPTCGCGEQMVTFGE